MEAVSSGRPGGSGLARVLRGFRPTLPTATGAFATGFVAALLMPMAWLSAICWNLYLDTLHPIFVEPLGNAARIGVGLGLGVIAMLLATAVVLALATPLAQEWLARWRGPTNGADDFSEFAAASDAPPAFTRRRSADVHPDAPPVAPINALRDLPAEGLGPVASTPVHEAVPEILPADAGAETLDLTAFILEPEVAVPETVDASLGAMVARLEAGLVRRDMLDDSSAPIVDLALEAALSTLARMNKSAVG